MKRMTAGDLQALELLMQTTPGFEHYDSGVDGIFPECRSCRFHRPFWKYQSFKIDVPESNNSDENTPFADAGDDETVSIPKDKYELMIDDLLTMSEIIQCVADMRTQDVKVIREFGKFVPAFAAFEKNRLSLYREAAKEAEEIFDRWADEIDDLDEDFIEDEDYEPDEYYSD